MNKEVDWVREFDELDGVAEVEESEIDWLEEFDKVIKEVESLPGYPGVAEVESEPDSRPPGWDPIKEDSTEAEIAESEKQREKFKSETEEDVEKVEEEGGLSKGKGNWLRELLNKKVVLPVATAVGILGLIWGGSLLVEREGKVVSDTVTSEATGTPVALARDEERSLEADTVASTLEPSVNILDWAKKAADFWGIDARTFSAGLKDAQDGVGGEPDRTNVLNEGSDDWGESGTPESAGGTGAEIEAEEPAVVANKVDLAPNQTEYVLRFGDTALSVAEAMKNDKLVSNQVEGLARLFKNNSWFSEGANLDKYRDYIPEINIALNTNPGVNPAEVTMKDGRTLAEWLIQVMHDVPVGLEINI